MGIGSNFTLQLVIFAAQFLLVPIMANSWGLERYGIWLMLSTIPAYLSLGDLGFGTAATNQMTMEVARGQQHEALVIYQNAFSLIAITAGALVVICTCVAATVSFGSSLLTAASEAEVRAALVILPLFGITCLMFSLPNGSLKAVGLYHLSGISLAAAMSFEAVVAGTLVYLGFDFAVVALGYLLCRCCSFGILLLVLRKRAPWIKFGFRHVSPQIMKRLAPPAAAVLAIAAAQALVFQGSTIVIGVAVASAAIAGFTTVRTLTRVGAQAVILVNRAVMPEFSRAWAQQNEPAIRKIIKYTALFSLLIVLPAGLALSLLGDWFIGVWTAGAVSIDDRLLYLMAGAMVVNGVWMPLSGLLIAINLQAGFAYRYLFLSIVGLALSYVLCQSIGVLGAGVGLLLLEVGACIVILLRILHLLRGIKDGTYA